MHRPPAASLCLKPNRWNLALVLVFALVSCLVSAAAWDTLGSFARMAVASSWLLSLAFALWQWRQAPKGELRWDGQSWHLATGGADHEVSPEMVVDLQCVVLIRLNKRHGHGAAWVFADAADVNGGTPGAWSAVRRALVYSAHKGRSGADTQIVEQH